MSIKEDLLKIKIDHIYKNMNDILKEVRFIDKIVLIFSGITWGWLLNKNTIVEYNIIYIIPFLLSILLSFKVFVLLIEYNKQKIKYKVCMSEERPNILNDDNKKDREEENICLIADICKFFKNNLQVEFSFATVFYTMINLFNFMFFIYILILKST